MGGDAAPLGCEVGCVGGGDMAGSGSSLGGDAAPFGSDDVARLAASLGGDVAVTRRRRWAVGESTSKPWIGPRTGIHQGTRRRRRRPRGGGVVVVEGKRDWGVTLL
jgi:hypothetical protein